MNIATLKNFVRQTQSGAYYRPANLKVALAQVVHLEKNLSVYDDQQHLLAAADWLKRAQDAQTDGGFAGRYSLRTGWSSSYPETTGYIVPTLLKLADELHDDDYVRRAQRAIDFLLSIQLESGAFPGREIAENRTEPSPFNTAQIMHGLQRWTERTGDERTREALRRAGNWLCEVQDPSGAWRKYFYLDLATSYSAHLTCWLAEAGAFLRDDRMLQAASRHLRWVLDHYDSQHGWFDLCGFSKDQHDLRQAVTHTISYTVWGVLRTAEVLGSAEGKAAAEKAAYAALRRLELSRRLPAILDYRWQSQESSACLTGNVQMALIWLHMYEEHGDPRLLSAALKAIDIVKAAQVMNGDDMGVVGGVAGSQPVWGEYIPHTYPNWAAKYFIDALLAKRKALDAEIPFRSKPVVSDEAVPAKLPPIVGTANPRKLKVALLTAQAATKVMEFTNAWSSWGFKPDFVLSERSHVPSILSRVQRRLAEGRITSAPGKQLPPQATKAHSNGTPVATSAVDFCRQAGIPVAEVDSINSPEAIRLLREQGIDLFVYAGAGILREVLIKAAPLGVLNAHMGILPEYRGMNVTEWAAWNGDPVGCTVHLIDSGIDTGDILLVREVDASSARNIGELRDLVDRCQIGLLGEVLEYVLATGALPKRRSQTASEGLQYFRMHDVLKDRLNRRLSGG